MLLLAYKTNPNKNKRKKATTKYVSFTWTTQYDYWAPGGGGGRELGLMFAGLVPRASQSPYPISVYFLANYRLHPTPFLENVIFAIPA